ncbi:hypothetical protein [Sphingomonas pituitosa]|uniref:hypothetical protein n=1 Tax=Sphingomonas pituitosa TaxID=99597 RepID=UPI000A7B16BA|nr:hypothetical protein [Sphingomonas pituitosa]
MSDRRSTLDFGALSDFAPKPRQPAPEHEQAQVAVDRHSGFPSRERADESQINIRAPADVLDRFKAMAKKDRYTYGAFLEILMDRFEAGK